MTTRRSPIRTIYRALDTFLVKPLYNLHVSRTRSCIRCTRFDQIDAVPTRFGRDGVAASLFHSHRIQESSALESTAPKVVDGVAAKGFVKRQPGLRCSSVRLMC